MKKLLLSLSFLMIGFTTFAQLTCATATTITANGTLTVPTLTGTYEVNCFTNTTATTPLGGPMNAIWYKYTATANGTVVVSSNLPTNVAPLSVDTRVSVTTGTCGALVCSTFNDDVSGSNYLSTASFTVTSGTTYYIMWDNVYSDLGFDFTFAFTLAPTCIGVTVVNEPTSVTMTSATLNWAAPTVVPAMYEIEYGVAPYLLGGGGTVATFSTNSVALSGLTANATYNYFIRSKCSATEFSGYTTSQSFSLMDADGGLVIYNTTGISSTGMEVTSTANGAATQMGDAIVLSGTARYLRSITANFFSLVVSTPYTLTMSLYTDCPTVTGAGVCGSGTGTLFPFSSPVTVNVTPTAIGASQDVVFPFADLDLSSETDNTLTVMINASRNSAIWTIGEKPTIGAMPAGQTGFGAVTRCGSTGTNNGCGRNFNIDNNARMKIVAASAPLATDRFLSNIFSISPNPANDLVKISNTDNININEISITDLNGRIVKTATYKNVSNIEINVADLTTGLYFLNINSDKGIVTKKIMKN